MKTFQAPVIVRASPVAFSFYMCLLQSMYNVIEAGESTVNPCTVIFEKY